MGKKRLCCEICGAPGLDWWALRRHYDVDHRYVNVFVCMEGGRQCGFFASDRPRLERHMVDKHRFSTCRACGKGYKRKGMRERHEHACLEGRAADLAGKLVEMTMKYLRGIGERGWEAGNVEDNREGGSCEGNETVLSKALQIVAKMGTRKQQSEGNRRLP